MGLSRAAIAWLIEEAQRRPFEGTLLTLGVQNVFLDQAAFEALADKMGFTLRPPGPAHQKTLIPGTITSEHAFTRMGFDRVVTTDIDAFEGCDFELTDLLFPSKNVSVWRNDDLIVRNFFANGDVSAFSLNR